MDLTSWRKHIDYVVKDEGQWLGILDENGLPLYELPAYSSVSFPEAHLDASSAEVVVPVSAGDTVLDDLVGEGLGVQDAAGRLVPASGPTRLLMLARPGERRVGTVTHTVAGGVSAPSTLTVHAVDLLNGLSWWPCPSIPVEWGRAQFTDWDTDASGEKYTSSRRLAQLQFATNADGYTKRGAAVSVIRDLIQDSFDAVNSLYGWADNPHAVVEYPTGVDESPEVFIRVNDDPVLDTVAEHARSAGVGIEVILWWPGDDAVRVRTSRDPRAFGFKSWPHPVQIVRVSHVKGE